MFQNVPSLLGGLLRFSRIFLLGVSCGILGPNCVWAETFQTDLPRALLVDAGTGTILFEKGADEPFEPASLAKIMTAEVLFHELKEKRLDLDKEFHVSEYAWRTGGGPSRGTAMFAAVNSKIAVKDLLRGLIIPSGNDAAIVLAEGVSGTETAFTRVMNRRASAIGLSQSSFANASGLPVSGQVTTARDLARLAAHVISNYPEFYAIFSEPEFTWNKIKQRNRNPLLGLNIGADGFLTGFTEKAGFGLVGSAVLDGQRLIVVVSGAKTARGRDSEARKLLDWGLRSFEPRELFAAGEVVGEARVFGGEKGTVSLVTPKPVRVLVQRGTDERMTARIVYRGPAVAPIKKNASLGHLQIERGKVTIIEVPLTTGEGVAQGSLSQRALDAVWEWCMKIVRRSLERVMQ